MRKTLTYILFIALLTGSCQKREQDDNFLSEDFEGITSTDQLFPDDDSRWSFYQQTESVNSISLDTTHEHGGAQCLKIYAKASGEGASKSDLARNHLFFKKGETVIFSAWYYIETTGSLDYLFLFDLEENAAIGAGPGLRFALEGKEGCLVVERKKMLQGTLRQDESSKVAFPTNQWVNLQIEVKLEQKKKGYIKVWQDNALLIEESDIQTMPKDRLYFIQGTKGVYDNAQVGITANTHDNEMVLYVDDILLKKK